MVAPGPGVAGATLAGASGTTAAVAVPAGVTAGQIILVDLYLEASRAVTAPAGFTEIGTVAATTKTWHHRFWKRATAADSGTYDFTWTTATFRRAVAVRYPGCIATGTPYDVGTGAPVNAARSAAGTASPAVALTTQGVDRLVVHSATSFAAGTWTQQTGFTERYDSGEITGAEKSQAAAGATGNVIATSTLSDSQTAWLLALIPAGVDVTADDSQPASATVSAPTDESVEALSANLAVDTDPPATTATGAPDGETVSVDLTDPTPVGVVHGAPAGALVSVSVDDETPASAMVGSPAGESAVAEEPGLPAGGAPFVSLWAVNPAGGGLIHLPHALQVDLSPVRNQAGAFRFDYPAFGKNFSVLHSRLVVDQVGLELELWVGGSRFNALGGDILRAEGDDVAEDSVWTFSGKFFTHRLARATVVHDAAQEKGERRFAAATAGTIMRTFLQEAQARGTLTDLSFATFSTTTDSAGVPWARTVTLKFTPYGNGGLLSVLARLVDLGLCEGEVDRDKRFLLYNAGGAGRDLTTRTPPTILRRGKDLLESNRRIDVEDAGTDLFGTGAEGLYASTFDATARAKWGAQIEKVIDSNQIENQAALTAFVQNARPQAVLAPMELTHGLVFGSNRPAPVSGFRINDWLYSDVGRGLERVRVAQWVLSQDVSGVQGSVTLNDVIADRLTRLARRLAAMSDGSAVVGTSQPPNVEDTQPPAAPTGVTADSVAYQDGSDTYATVLVGWAAVNTNADGTAADDIAGYRVEYRYQSGPSTGWIVGKDQPGGSATSTSFGGVGAGINIILRVFAYDTNGNTSAPSAEVLITTQTDATAPPVPSTPVVTPYLGQIKVAWNGLGSAGEAMPADLDYVELHISQASNFTPVPGTLADTFSMVRGERVITNLPYGVAQFVRLIAVDMTRPVPNKSGPSAQGSATPSKVVGDDVLAGAVGSLQLADLAVVSAKIGLLAVNDAQFGGASVGKLEAGVLNVAVTNAGIIRTGTTGARTEQDSGGFRVYNGAGTQTIALVPSGISYITGEFRTALTGMRFVWNAGGVEPDVLRIYPAAGANYATITADELSGQAVFKARGNSTRGDQSAGEVGAWPTEGFIAWAISGSNVPFTRITCRQTNNEIVGPNNRIIMEERYPQPGGAGRYTSLYHRTSSGVDIGQSFIHHQRGSDNSAWLHQPVNNSGLIFAPNFMLVCNSVGSAIGITASSFDVVSGEQFKRQIRRPDLGTVDGVPVRARDVTRRVRVQQFEYRSDGERPATPGLRLRTGIAEDGTETYADAEWSTPPSPARTHIGLIAEDVAVVAPQLVSTDEPGRPKLSVMGVAAMAWDASADNADDIDQIRADLTQIRAQIAALHPGGPL